jgi:hypothetical protein
MLKNRLSMSNFGVKKSLHCPCCSEPAILISFEYSWAYPRELPPPSRMRELAGRYQKYTDGRIQICTNCGEEIVFDLRRRKLVQSTKTRYLVTKTEFELMDRELENLERRVVGSKRELV